MVKNTKQKKFKHKKLRKFMGKGYKTYSEAERNRKSGEITIYNPDNGLYYNILISKKRKNSEWGLGSIW